MAPSLQVRDFKKDVVYLFQRRNTFSERGANGLLPFIELNGVQICESQVILNRLAELFGLKNYEDARAEGIGHSLERMIENHTLHLLRIDLNRTLPDLVKVIVKQRVPGFAVDVVSSLGASYMRKKTRGGVKDAIGQFTTEEYDEMLRNDMIQLQNVLGANQFLMGASPTRVDCLALAHIGHSYFRLPQSRSYIHELIDSAELSVFKQYLERTVKTIFGDNFNNKE